MTIRSRAKPGSGATEALPASPAALDHGAITAALEAWFPRAARPLPWRSRRSGYHALVSELMLQQTQVARVVDAFERFVARFPSVAQLASAGEPDVLGAWQGLGYYRRARLLHAAARAVCDRHGGSVPADAASLQALPGVGRYTAGAIASIAFGAREPIVDGNVLRVLSRLADRPTRAGDPDSERWAWLEARRYVEASTDPAVANEALMELGATVCTPAAPRCAQCPLAGPCLGRASGRAPGIPAPRAAPSRRQVHWDVLVHADGEGLLVRDRPLRGLWAGMPHPPVVEGDAPADESALAAAWGVALREAGRFLHRTSHRDVLYRVHVSAGDRAPKLADVRRIPLAELAAAALPNSAWRAIECAGVPVRTPPSASAGRRGRRAARAPSGS